MTVDELLDKIEHLDQPQELDDTYDGGCPCFNVTVNIEGKLLRVMGRCWRVSGGPQGQQDLHIWGPDLPVHDVGRVAGLLKLKLDQQEWYGPYTIILDAPDWRTA